MTLTEVFNDDIASRVAMIIAAEDGAQQTLDVVRPGQFRLNIASTWGIFLAGITYIPEKMGPAGVWGCLACVSAAAFWLNRCYTRNLMCSLTPVYENQVVLQQAAIKCAHRDLPIDVDLGHEVNLYRDLRRANCFGVDQDNLGVKDAINRYEACLERRESGVFANKEDTLSISMRRVAYTVSGLR